MKVYKATVFYVSGGAAVPHVQTIEGELVTVFGEERIAYKHGDHVFILDSMSSSYPHHVFVQGRDAWECANRLANEENSSLLNRCSMAESAARDAVLSAGAAIDRAEQHENWGKWHEQSE